MRREKVLVELSDPHKIYRTYYYLSAVAPTLNPKSCYVFMHNKTSNGKKNQIFNKMEYIKNKEFKDFTKQ